MKLKPIAVALCVAVSAAALSTTAYAATSRSEGSSFVSKAAKALGFSREPNEEKVTEWKQELKDRLHLTEEQLAEWEDWFSQRPELPGNPDGEKSTRRSPRELPDDLDEDIKARLNDLESKIGDMKTRMNSMKEKWDALTDEQKEELYALQDNAAGVYAQIIDKYLEFGLIDEETAAEWKSMLEEGTLKLRENGSMPGFGGIRAGKRLFEKPSSDNEMGALSGSSATTA